MPAKKSPKGKSPRKLTAYNLFVRKEMKALNRLVTEENRPTKQTDKMSAIARLWRQQNKTATPKRKSRPTKRRSPKAKGSPSRSPLGSLRCNSLFRAKCDALGKVCHANTQRRSCRKSA